VKVIFPGFHRSVEDPGLVLSEPRSRREGSAPKTAQTVHF